MTQMCTQVLDFLRTQVHRVRQNLSGRNALSFFMELGLRMRMSVLSRPRFPLVTFP